MAQVSNKDILNKLEERDGPNCKICGVVTVKIENGRVGRDSRTLDHIIAQALGGPDQWSNYQILCSRCNCLKGNRERQDKLAIKVEKKLAPTRVWAKLQEPPSPPSLLERLDYCFNIKAVSMAAASMVFLIATYLVTGINHRS